MLSPCSPAAGEFYLQESAVHFRESIHGRRAWELTFEIGDNLSFQHCVQGIYPPCFLGSCSTSPHTKSDWSLHAKQGLTPARQLKHCVAVTVGHLGVQHSTAGLPCWQPPALLVVPRVHHCWLAVSGTYGLGWVWAQHRTSRHLELSKLKSSCLEY